MGAVLQRRPSCRRRAATAAGVRHKHEQHCSVQRSHVSLCCATRKGLKALQQRLHALAVACGCLRGPHGACDRAAAVQPWQVCMAGGTHRCAGVNQVQARDSLHLCVQQLSRLISDVAYTRTCTRGVHAVLCPPASASDSQSRCAASTSRLTATLSSAVAGVDRCTCGRSGTHSSSNNSRRAARQQPAVAYRWSGMRCKATAPARK